MSDFLIGVVWLIIAGAILAFIFVAHREFVLAPWLERQFCQALHQEDLRLDCAKILGD